PAVSSHTSLPSHTGPMVLIITRRSVSSRPSTGTSIPTPKSNPSSTRYPVQSTAMRTNQTSDSSTVDPSQSTISSSVRERQRPVALARRRGAGLGAGVDLAVRHAGRGVALHEAEPDDGEHAVQERERDEGGEHRAPA